MAQEPTKLFISYKTGEATGVTFQARSIKKELENRKDANYHLFLDRTHRHAIRGIRILL